MSWGIQERAGSLGANMLSHAADNQEPGHRRFRKLQHYHKLLLLSPPPLASDSCPSPRKYDSMSQIRLIFILDPFPSSIHHVALQIDVLAEYSG
ncbi:hypothetical protein llap_14616 [Limosa lapponica baueri]|uniref:Uncharacterized protein n=1 Tax=Limosa lapponica baueri TaxID=1758121 RepID=A0A2I0TMN6_LIMLA|nr:hypothetical protein llap_14616 [Limosa lapponica baueri]